MFYYLSNNKDADQTTRMRRLIAPLLFAYGINRFSLDMAEVFNRTQTKCQADSPFPAELPTGYTHTANKK